MHIGLKANKAGYIEHASKLADFCWRVLDYTKAVGEGVYLGATNTLHTLTHQDDEAKTIAEKILLQDPTNSTALKTLAEIANTAEIPYKT